MVLPTRIVGMVSELAAASGMHPVHFNISGKGYAEGPFGPPQPFDRSHDIHSMVKSVLDEKISDSLCILMDMRPLRPLIKINESDEIKKLVFGYNF